MELNSLKSPSTKTHGQLAGLIYLLIAIIGGFSIGYMPSEIVVATSAAETYQNLQDHFVLFQSGIAGDIVVLILEMVLTAMMFRLFRALNPTGMLIATFSRFAMAVIMGINLINYMVPGLLAMDVAIVQSFIQADREAIALLFFKAHKFGELAWQVFFALHLVGLGMAIRTTSKVPKFLGILMIIGGIGYAGDSISQLLLVQFEAITITFNSLLVAAVIAELWFAFWLLIKGYQPAKG